MSPAYTRVSNLRAVYGSITKSQLYSAAERLIPKYRAQIVACSSVHQSPVAQENAGWHYAAIRFNHIAKFEITAIINGKDVLFEEALARPRKGVRIAF